MLGDGNISDESWSDVRLDAKKRGRSVKVWGGDGEKRHHVTNSLEFFKLLRGCLDCDDDFS